MADEGASPRLADEGASPRHRAREAAEGGQMWRSIAWSLLSIADDVAALRRDSDWQRRHASAGRRG